MACPDEWNTMISWLWSRIEGTVTFPDLISARLLIWWSLVNLSVLCTLKHDSHKNIPQGAHDAIATFLSWHDWQVGGVSLLSRSCISTISTRRAAEKFNGSAFTEEPPVTGTVALHSGQYIAFSACCHSTSRHFAQNVWRQGSILGSSKMARQTPQVTSLRTFSHPPSILA